MILSRCDVAMSAGGSIDDMLVSSVLVALRYAVSAPGALLRFLGGAEARGALGRSVDGRVTVETSDVPVDEAFGLSGEEMRACRALLVSPGRGRVAGSYWRDRSLPDGFDRALVLTLHDGAELLGLVGVERRAWDAPFSRDDADILGALRPLFRSAIEARNRATAPGRKAAAPNTFRNGWGGGAVRLPLSPREREVASLLAVGHSSGTVAALCHVSLHTVRSFTRRIYRKLGVLNRTGLVREMMRLSGEDEGRGDR